VPKVTPSRQKLQAVFFYQSSGHPGSVLVQISVLVIEEMASVLLAAMFTPDSPISIPLVPLKERALRNKFLTSFLPAERSESLFFLFETMASAPLESGPSRQQIIKTLP
jgi:hypothetical protein